MKKMIVIVILCVAVALLIYYVYNKQVVKYRALGNIISKPFTIIIEDNEVIDYKRVKYEEILDFKKVRNGEKRFSMLNYYDRNDLANYLKKNNFMISPGTYNVGTGMAFDELIHVFKFQKIK